MKRMDAWQQLWPARTAVMITHAGTGERRILEAPRSGWSRRTVASALRPYEGPSWWIEVAHPAEIPGSLRWVAVDWDNKEDDRMIAAGIASARLALVVAAEKCGVRWLNWPSKSTTEHPQSGAGHTFLRMPSGLSVNGVQWARGLLSKALGWSVEQASGWDLERWGLNGQGHYIFPPDDLISVKMSVCQVRDLSLFLHRWALMGSFLGNLSESKNFCQDSWDTPYN